VPLYDISFLAQLPGPYYFYSPTQQEGKFGFPSVYKPTKNIFGGGASSLVSIELGIPDWIESTLKW
jgi:hypothetical protein